MMMRVKQQSQQKEAAWGGPVITVNWFNVGIHGKKDEKLSERRADRVIEFSLQASLQLARCDKEQYRYSLSVA